MATKEQRIKFRLVAVSLLLFLSGCIPLSPKREEAAVFIPPTVAVTPTPIPGPTISVSTPDVPRPTENASCSNLLAYVKDLTIPDGSMFSPGESIDKRWLVENQGTCNWNPRYSLRLSGGDSLGAPKEQSLVPAIAGSQAVIRITFTAPEKGGKYRSSWQAYTPDSKPFGDPVYVEIEVIPRVEPSPVR